MSCRSSSVSFPEDLQKKSLYISPAVSHFYGTEYEIWAGFGPVGSTEDFGLGHKVDYF